MNYGLLAAYPTSISRFYVHFDLLDIISLFETPLQLVSGT
jgi:hypothetical protein